MFDVHMSIEQPEGDLNEEAVAEYIDGLAEEFWKSPEAKPILDEFGETGWAGMMMAYAIDYLGVTPPEMSVSDFKEVVFQLIPRKVSTEPSSAGEIVAELRAFWSFLQRAY